MVQQQIRPWKVLDFDVLDVMGRLPREKFVAPELQSLAYADTSLPLGNGQVMLTPKEQGRIAECLQLSRGDRVLEVGTGSGYLTAVLASLAGQVTTVDIFDDFVESARSRLNELGIDNVQWEVGDAANGWDKGAPFDAIAITGSLLEVPDVYKQSLKVGGRLFCIVGVEPAMQARLIVKTGDDAFSDTGIFETLVPRLVHAPEPVQFQF
jgi:protein-L-isoaspartate(D-aspartate) O-methyltransferase